MGFVLGLWLLEVFVAERHWLTTLITYSPQHWIGVPSVVLIVWALARRAWLPAGLNLVAVGIFYFALLGPAIPLGMPRIFSDGHTVVRVMTWNIHHASGGVDGIMAVVRNAHPDLVCFQEANDGYWRSDVLPELRRAFRGWHRSEFREVVTFSRYPIVTEQVHPLMPETGRVVLETVVDVNDEWLTIYNVHLNVAIAGRSLRRSGLRGMPAYLRHTAEVRLDQIRDLDNVTSRAMSRSIIVGDFNTPPRGLCYRRLTRRHSDVFKQEGSGLGYTFPSHRPLMRIDYVFADDVGALGCFVSDVRASDHRALIADLVIPRKER